MKKLTGIFCFSGESFYNTVYPVNYLAFAANELSTSLTLFIFLLSFQFGICGFTIAAGGAARLVFGYDSYGNTCGQSNEPIEGVRLSGLDHTDRKWVSSSFLPLSPVFHTLHHHKPSFFLPPHSLLLHTHFLCRKWSVVKLDLSSSCPSIITSMQMSNGWRFTSRWLRTIWATHTSLE